MLGSFPRNPQVPFSQIRGVTFAPCSSEFYEQTSSGPVVSRELFRGGQPVPGGIYGAHMGTAEYAWPCDTCKQRCMTCPGHFGHLKLNYPVKLALVQDDILRWLRVACHGCGELIIQKIPPVPRMEILSEAAKLAKKVKECPHCAHPVYDVRRDKLESTVIHLIMSNTQRVELYNHKIHEIFSRISNKTVELLGKSRECHPSKFILWTIGIPPNTIRPDTKRLTNGSKANSDDLTAFIKALVERNALLPDVIPDDSQLSPSIRAGYVLLDVTFRDMTLGGSSPKQLHATTVSNTKLVGIAPLIVGKRGLIRGHIMGKRVIYMSRSVITGDTHIKVDEIGVPLKIAKQIFIPEVVNPANIKRLTAFFLNKDEYPGSVKLTKSSDGRTYKVSMLSDYNLQIGDVLYRHLITGDFIDFNRQPTLDHGSIMCHRVVVSNESDTFRMNLSATTPYNADFDGDEMSVIVMQNVQARTEISMLSRVGRHMINVADSLPGLGEIQDGIIGPVQLSRDGITFNKWHAMQMLADDDGDIKRDFEDRTHTNYELISRVLPEVNLRKIPTIFKAEYAAALRYNPKDVKQVIIDLGIYKGGILDKASLGTGVSGSLFHVINNQLGADAALATMYSLQILGNSWFRYESFTVGARDIDFSPRVLAQVRSKIQEMLVRSEEITRRLDTGRLIPPMGVSVSDYYESLQRNVANTVEGFIIPLLSEMDFETNGLARMILAGSKGNEVNYAGINGALRGATVNGERRPRTAGWGRTGPYWRRFEMDPRALGFIERSYVQGIESSTFEATAEEARSATITNALSTSVTGHQSRESGKNLESVVINNMFQSAKPNGSIIQPLYAGNGLDPRSLEQVKMPHIMMSNADFEKNFRAVASDFPGKGIGPALDAEFLQLKKDRDEFRQTFLRLEAGDPRGFLFGENVRLPINPSRIIDDAKHRYVDLPEEKFDVLKAIEAVKTLCEELPYVFSNEHCRKNKRRIPEHMRYACHTAVMAIRAYLCVAQLRKHKISNTVLDIILREMWTVYKRSLIAYGTAVGVLGAQCVSAMATQSMLDSRHTAGTGGQKTSGIIRYKEILRARATKDMREAFMFVMCKPEIELSRTQVQEVANRIEMIQFSRFIQTIHVFFEEYGKPTHPQFKHEAALIKEITQLNLSRKIPGDLSNWCIRFGLDREQMLLKSFSLEDIMLSLQKSFPHVYFIHTPENSKVLFLRGYIRASAFKTQFTEDFIRKLRVDISKCILRGIPGILTADVIDVLQSFVDQDGSIKTRKIYCISTDGSNLAGVLMHPMVDVSRTQSNSISEIEHMFGIVSANSTIVVEMVRTNPKTSVIHAGVYADEMTSPGTVTPISRSGLGARGYGSVMLLLSYQSVLATLRKAITDNMSDQLGGTSDSLMVGQIPPVGTFYNNVVLNQTFVESDTRGLDNMLDYV